MTEPGLDLHEWQTRWSELDEAAHDSPAEAVEEMDRLLEEMLLERGHSLEPVLVELEEPEAVAQFRAARDCRLHLDVTACPNRVPRWLTAR